MGSMGQFCIKIEPNATMKTFSQPKNSQIPGEVVWRGSDEANKASKQQIPEEALKLKLISPINSPSQITLTDKRVSYDATQRLKSKKHSNFENKRQSTEKKYQSLVETNRDEKAFDREKRSMSFFVKNPRLSEVPKTSNLMYRTDTLKSKGIKHACEADIEQYSEIVKQEKDLHLKLSSAPNPSLVPPSDSQKAHQTERELRMKYNRLKEHRHKLQAKYRNIQSHYPEGITGVEQPGDSSKASKQESIIYKGYNNLLASNKKSSEYRHANRLKSKLLILDRTALTCIL